MPPNLVEVASSLVEQKVCTEASAAFSAALIMGSSHYYPFPSISHTWDSRTILICIRKKMRNRILICANPLQLQYCRTSLASSVTGPRNVSRSYLLLQRLVESSSKRQNVRHTLARLLHLFWNFPAFSMGHKSSPPRFAPFQASLLVSLTSQR